MNKRQIKLALGSLALLLNLLFASGCTEDQDFEDIKIEQEGSFTDPDDDPTGCNSEGCGEGG